MRRPALLLALLLLSASARAQDRSFIEDRRPLEERPHAAKAALPTAIDARRVLVIGDSWAQYMWDDGSHDDLLDRFGLADHQAYSLSLGSDPGPGHTGPEVAISGSEARQWVDTANYPWIANTVAVLQANPTIDRVVLSIGGNDVLAGKSDGGWYKDMDLDVPGSEAALFAQIETDTQTIIDAILAVRPDIRVILSSYDYPNFNVGFWCFVYACPKREDLSRDSINDLITDEELNGMMVLVETMRRAWATNWSRVDFDNSIGLMHHVYGDGVSPAWTLPRPGTTPDLYEPFPGGNPVLPSPRSAFRLANGLDADPIHLDFDGYQHKIGQQMLAHLLPSYRGQPEQSVQATLAGWTDGTQAVADQLRVGDDGVSRRAAILEFDLSPWAPIAQLDRATLFLSRVGGTGASPFESGAQGSVTADLAVAHFGASAAVETDDLTAAASLSDAAWVVGSATANGYAIRLELKPAALDLLEGASGFQLRLSFASVDAGEQWVEFGSPSAGAASQQQVAAFAWVSGSNAPLLDLHFDPLVAAPRPLARTLIQSIHPNPFNPRVEIRYRTEKAAPLGISIHDARGRLIREWQEARIPAGEYALLWDGTADDGRRAASGVYHLRVRSGSTIDRRKLTLIK